MKYYVGIDPGKQGAIAIISENSEIIEKIAAPLLGNEYDKKTIVEILKSREFAHVGLENPGVLFGTSKSSHGSLQKSVGMYEGILAALEIPHSIIQPKEWQKECWKLVKIQKKSSGKGNDTKATSALAASNIWPREDFKITNNGNKSTKYNDGFIDAALIAEYVRRIYR